MLKVLLSPSNEISPVDDARERLHKSRGIHWHNF